MSVPIIVKKDAIILHKACSNTPQFLISFISSLSTFISLTLSYIGIPSASLGLTKSPRNFPFIPAILSMYIKSPGVPSERLRQGTQALWSICT